MSGCNGCSQVTSQKFELTHKAAQKLREFMKDENKEGSMLKVETESSGCSVAYALDFVESVNEGESVIEQHGLKIVIGKDSLKHMAGVTLDYTEQGFTIKAPLACGGCCR